MPDSSENKSNTPASDPSGPSDLSDRRDQNQHPNRHGTHQQPPLDTSQLNTASIATQIKYRAKQLKNKAQTLMASPVDDLARLPRTIRYATDLSLFVGQQLKQDRAAQMAAALSFRTVFSLVPLCVAALLFFKGVDRFDDASVWIKQTVLNYVALPEHQQTDTDETGETQSDFSESSTDSNALIQDNTAATTDLTNESELLNPPNLITSPQTWDATKNNSKTEWPLATQPSQNSTWGNNQTDFFSQDQDEQAHDAQLAGLRHELESSLDQLLTDIKLAIEKINLRSIGVIGAVLFLWAALRLIVTIEQTFNQVVRSDASRPWHKRVIAYWSVITLGPVLLAVSLYTVGRLLNKGSDLPFIGELLVGTIKTLIPISAAWLLLFFVYRSLPKRRLDIKHLLTGSLVGAILWELWKYAFRIYLKNSFGGEGGAGVLYGSLALVPVFLLWVYVTWLIVLFGLSLAYTLHAMPDLRRDHDGTAAQQSGIVDPRWLLPLLAGIYQAFLEGKTAQSSQLAQQCELPTQAVDYLLKHLKQAGLVHYVAEDEFQTRRKANLTQEGYCLSKPPESIAAESVIGLMNQLSDNPHVQNDHPGIALYRHMLKQEQSAVKNQNLKDWLNQSS